MRKWGILCGALCAALAMFAGTASAAQHKTFTLIAHESDGHGDQSSFVFNEKLYSHGKQVGRDHIKISQQINGSFEVSALFRLHRGKITAVGALRKGNDQSIPIIGGKGRFHGVSGSVEVNSLGHHVERETFHLTR